MKALLDWRNTPIAGVGTRPADGTAVQDTVTRAGTLLIPRYDIDNDARGLLGIKRRQQHYAKQSAKPHKPINTGDAIRMMLPGQKRWRFGTCIGQIVNVGGASTPETDANR